MKLKKVEVDSSFREKYSFRDTSFPVGMCMDHFSHFYDHTINCHWHNAFEYGLVLRGEVDYHINEESFVLKSGDCVFVNANAMHMAKQREGAGDALMFSVFFPYNLLTNDINSTIFTEYIQMFFNKPLQGFKISTEVRQGKEIIQNLSDIHNLNETDFGFELCCLSLISRMWINTVSYVAEIDAELFHSSHDRRYEERAKQILSYMHDHYGDSITIKDVARGTAISLSECYRCVKRFTGKNPMEYLNEYRLAKAAGFLLGTNDTITEISSNCGFGGSSYFGKIFREHYGVSPLKYRREAQETKDEGGAGYFKKSVM